MLLAVTFDANSDIFPIAICICESKSTNSWKWFLQILFEYIGEQETRRITFMSDR